MKIAFVIGSLAKGGAEKVVSLLSSELLKKHHVYLILFNNIIEHKINSNLKIININVPASKFLYRKIINVIRRTYYLYMLFNKEKFDRIFSFAESCNIPVILTRYKTYISIRTHPKRFTNVSKIIFSILYRLNNIQKIITPSKGIEKFVSSWLQTNNIVTINNPSDLNLISSLKIKNIDISYDFIVAIGRLDKVKNFELLIRAYANSNVKDFAKLLILGDGNEKNYLRTLSIDLRVENKVIFYGKTDNPYKYLDKAKLYILSSKYEGYPNSLIDALACNCPSIATNCPTGPSELIVNNVNGILVSNNNIKELTRAMDHLFFDTDMQNRFKTNAYNSVKKLDVKKIANRWIGL